LSELAGETRLDETSLENELEHLEHAGLLRRLHSSDHVQEQRTWQIAHDFLATLIERVLDGIHRTFWRTLRSWLAPAAVAIALCAGVVWPWVEKQVMLNALYDAGFTWNEKDAEIDAATSRGLAIRDVAEISRPLHWLKPRSLDLRGCEALQNVNGLKGLTNLQSLDLSECFALENVNGLEGLANLQSLDLSYCRQLQNVDGLKGLAKLEVLDLSFCEKLPKEGWDALKAALPKTSIHFPNFRKNVQSVPGIDREPRKPKP
jgi:hypothetical protein